MTCNQFPTKQVPHHLIPIRKKWKTNI